MASIFTRTVWDSHDCDHVWCLMASCWVSVAQLAFRVARYLLQAVMP